MMLVTSLSYAAKISSLLTNRLTATINFSRFHRNSDRQKKTANHDKTRLFGTWPNSTTPGKPSAKLAPKGEVGGSNPFWDAIEEKSVKRLLFFYSTHC